MLNKYKSHIETDKSFLRTYKVVSIKDLADACVIEVSDLLIVNPPIIVFGKKAIQHRSVGFFSNESIGYKFSGQIAKAIPLTPNLDILLKFVNDTFESDFNGILINRYDCGSEYIGAHSDDEKNLSNIGVLAISIGEIRNFRIRNKKTKKIIKNIPTIPYEILHMGYRRSRNLINFVDLGGNFQKEFTHEIPVEKRREGIRYSFTFRKHLE
jgi:alkylated DNA repair dioxygenase AlkB